jgi:hypothetical protein
MLIIADGIKNHEVRSCQFPISDFHVFSLTYNQVFCYPCILHYLSTSESKWARCPICFDSVNERQLKSVKWFDGQESDEYNTRSQSSTASPSSDTTFEVPRAGSSLKMRLIQRPQITTLALPRSPTWPSDLLPPHQTPFHFLPDVQNFAKFMLATPDYLVGNLNNELDELATERLALESTSDSLGVVFIDAAETKVREQIAKASALESSIPKGKIEKTWRELEKTKERSSFSARRIYEDPQPAAGTEEVLHEFLRSSSRSASTTISAMPTSLRPQLPHQPRQRRNLNPPPPSTSSYYFYQAASGLPLFLHPLDIRILLSHFHSYSSFPDSITVRVEFVSLGSVNDDLRKRCKYLAHMPEGTDVAFIESDLKSVVCSEGLKHFEVPLRMRTAKRKEKERKEEKARSKAEEREKLKLNVTLSEWASSAHSAIPDRYPRESIAQSSSQAPIPTPVDSATSSSAGVWGTHSFASALHSSSAPKSVSPPQQRSSNLTVEDEWDVDVAWHELEQRNAGGRRKRANKLVILGSGGGGARRR